MKLSICCLYVANESPDLVILDEPANNIDLNSQEILIRALQQYKGTVLLVSHDPYLSAALSITQEIDLGRQD
jgi:ATPase subunit of ABC transporter with duplicated ATPase domains